MDAITKQFRVVMFENADEAAAAGYSYGNGNNEQSREPIKLTQVVIVRKGTVEGNATLDLLLTDEHGNDYVTLITANLLKALPI